MSQNAAFDDASIPVLTEFVEEAPLTTQPAPELESVPVLEDAVAEAEVPPAPATSAPSVAEAAPAQPIEADLQERAIDHWSELEWDQLERRLCERILHQLQGRVDFVLEQRLRDSMAEVLQQSISGMTVQIREGLQQTIEKIVVRAVAQELAHLQTLKK